MCSVWLNKLERQQKKSEISVQTINEPLWFVWLNCTDKNTEYTRNSTKLKRFGHNVSTHDSVWHRKKPSKSNECVSSISVLCSGFVFSWRRYLSLSVSLSTSLSLSLVYVKSGAYVVFYDGHSSMFLLSIDKLNTCCWYSNDHFILFHTKKIRT